jgi:threonylcarbamoyladenosine tRNA methylthiotransferase MtaB
MEFSKVHVFPYSQRPGTPALSMPGQVSPEVRHARTLEMVEISARLEATYAVRHLGTVRPVLWEIRSEDGTWHGLTDNYLRAHTRNPADLQNSITPALLSAYDARGLWVEVR